ncbi:MAG: lipopolysaccharide kinase InaA family protein [Phycisphaerae bacterium]
MAQTNPSGPSFTVIPGNESILDSLSLQSATGLFADAITAGDKAESLHKPGLEPWRQRWRLTTPSGQILYLKKFTNPPTSSRKAFQHLTPKVRSLAGLEAFWMTRLHEKGIPTIKPVAWAEEMDSSGTRERQSAILMHAVPGQSLESWCLEPAVTLTINRSKVMKGVAELAARLHSAGLFHRDLYLSHIFYEQAATPKDDRPQDTSNLHLIDLTRIVEDRSDALRRRVKDLAALNHSTPFDLVSNTQRVRWLKQYLHTPKLTAQQRRLLYRIVGKTAAMKRHDRRRSQRRSRNADA